MSAWAALLFVAVPTVALAGRPGTPEDVVAWVDGETVTTKQPAVCVRFRNTATVNVGFFVEWSKNGQQYTGKDLLGGAVRCNEHGRFAYASSCVAGFFYRAQGASVRPSEAAQVMCLRDFEPETEYCFRFRSFDEDGLWSQSWSPTSCAKTPPTPALPPAPDLPQLTLLPAETGRGTVGDPKPARALLEWAKHTSSPLDGEYIIQWKPVKSTNWSDVSEMVVGRIFTNSMKGQEEFEAQIPFVDHPPPSDTRRYEFRVCAANWGGRSCSAARMTPLGLQQQAKLEVEIGESGGAAAGARLRAEVARGPHHQAGSSADPTVIQPDPSSLVAQGGALAAADPLATMLRDSLTSDEARSGFDIAMAAVRDQTEWGPGKQKILDSLRGPARSGFQTAWSYLSDRNRHAGRARLGASMATADAGLASERSGDPDARYRLGFDIATAIFGNPAQGAQGNTVAGPGATGIRNSLSAPAQRGFDAAMKMHLGRKY